MIAEHGRNRFNALLAEAGLAPVESQTVERFERYLSLFIRWNARVNLSSIRDEERIIIRHFAESIMCARALPPGISTLLDYGSGAGLPGIPVALCRPEISVTLAESQSKKAAFLLEAIRVLELKAAVYAGRAELLEGSFDCVILRAVERMAEAVKTASRLVAARGFLALMTTRGDLERLQAAAGAGLAWVPAIPLPKSVDRILSLGSRVDSPV